MIIVNQVTKTDSTIKIPEAIVAGFGFVPDTRVEMGVLTTQSDSGLELCINQYPKVASKNLFQITALLYEGIGVLKRFHDSVASLQINIINQESCSVQGGTRHLVTLLCDWSQSNQYSIHIPIEPFIDSKLGEKRPLIPGNDGRYIILLQSILEQCLEFLDWKDGPNITIRPFDEDKNTLNPGDTVIKSELGEAVIALPSHIIDQIRRGTNNESGPLAYLLSFHTDSRTLRLFFLNKGIENNIISLFFSFLDEPGVLAKLQFAIAKSNFNVLASYSVKKTLQNNTWYAILECKDPKRAIPSNIDERLSWFDKSLEINPALADTFRRREVQISLVTDDFLSVKGTIWPYEANIEITESPVQDSSNPQLSVDESRQRRRFFRQFANEFLKGEAAHIQSLGTHRIGIIFLSYPGKAHALATLAKEKLQDIGFEVDLYQAPDNNDLPGEAIDRIRDADYFVGLWHNGEVAQIDELDPSDSKAKSRKRPSEEEKHLSAWMLFEFGVALAYKKDYAIIAHKSIPVNKYRNVFPHRTTPTYTNNLKSFEKAFETVINKAMTWKVNF